MASPIRRMMYREKRQRKTDVFCRWHLFCFVFCFCVFVFCFLFCFVLFCFVCFLFCGFLSVFFFSFSKRTNRKKKKKTQYNKYNLKITNVFVLWGLPFFFYHFRKISFFRYHKQKKRKHKQYNPIQYLSKITTRKLTKKNK